MTADCGVCAVHRDERSKDLIAWQSEHWVVRHHALPAPLPGWFLLDARRHVASAADFNEAEEREFAAILGRTMRAIKRAAGVPRVYVIMFGEGAAHLHAHLIPRDPKLTETAAWKVADLYRAVECGGRAPADPAAVAKMVAAVAVDLHENHAALSE